MTLSIKALEPKPENAERKPRAKADGEVKEKGKKPAKAKVSDEVTEWADDSVGGVSIADLLNKNS